MPESVGTDPSGSCLQEVSTCFAISALLGAGMDGKEKGNGDLQLSVL